jgi:hypothetical protein
VGRGWVTAMAWMVLMSSVVLVLIVQGAEGLPSWELEEVS